MLPPLLPHPSTSPSDVWKTQQQGCVQSLHEGVEGLVSLLRQFSQSQTSAVRERSRVVQDSLTQSQTDTKQFQVTSYSLH